MRGQHTTHPDRLVHNGVPGTFAVPPAVEFWVRRPTQQRARPQHGRGLAVSSAAAAAAGAATHGCRVPTVPPAELDSVLAPVGVGAATATASTAAHGAASVAAAAGSKQSGAAAAAAAAGVRPLVVWFDQAVGMASQTPAAADQAIRETERAAGVEIVGHTTVAAAAAFTRTHCVRSVRGRRPFSHRTPDPLPEHSWGGVSPYRVEAGERAACRGTQKRNGWPRWVVAAVGGCWLTIVAAAGGRAGAAAVPGPARCRAGPARVGGGRHRRCWGRGSGRWRQRCRPPPRPSGSARG